jgi:hypothetical protein
MKSTFIDVAIVLIVPILLVGWFLYTKSEVVPVADGTVSSTLTARSKEIESQVTQVGSLNFDTAAFQYISYLKLPRSVQATIPTGTFPKKANPFIH